MSDLVKQLRVDAPLTQRHTPEYTARKLIEAADEIERLEKHQPYVYANGFAAGKAAVLEDMWEWFYENEKKLKHEEPQYLLYAYEKDRLNEPD